MLLTAILTCANIALTVLVLFRLRASPTVGTVRDATRPEPLSKLDYRHSGRFKPIKHEPAKGPRTSTLIGRSDGDLGSVGYYVAKSKPDAEPFIAAHYTKEMKTLVPTFDANAAVEEVEEIIPADTYIDLMGRRIPGKDFREHFEPAPAAIEVSKFKSKRSPAPTVQATSFPLASAKPTPKLTEEEEKALAEEYELGEPATAPEAKAPPTGGT
jgi:hypothetical protein